MNDIKNKFINLKVTFRKKYWPDPVWSKVISAGIIAILGFIFLNLYAGLTSVISNVPFKSVVIQMVDYFKLSTEVNNLFFWFLILILVVALFSFFWSFIIAIISKIKSYKLGADDIEKQAKQPPIAGSPSDFFSSRLAEAFPGQRGLSWYEPKIAVQRLRILFREPLKCRIIGQEGVCEPIWWFRGGSDLSINRFDVLSKTKILLGTKELELKSIAVYVNSSGYKSFIYLEVKSEKQTGLYNLTQIQIDNHIKEFGYSWEEYGLLNNKPISRAEYDDGSAVIKDKVVDASKAELRERFLSNYNLVIAAHGSAYSSNKFLKETEKMFNDLLTGKMTAEIFFKYLETLKRERFY